MNGYGMKCDVCGFETSNRESFAGHRSAHVRRGELAKKQINKNHACHCGATFETGQKLGAHKRTHQYHDRPFDEIKTDGARKRALLRERGNQCEVCSSAEWMNQPCPIHLDHIDGNTDNNVKENLRLICPNCHAQTSTYCGKNKGHYTSITKRGRYTRKHYSKYVNLLP